ncbi:hypothetical protein [Paracraurococcus ruber]|uniref:Uncharacterized protein n=1 Tax=Paracraurococcus ruber TaxID=77675 RepID=A0ABS1D5I3_9PROT|nr:hypothetical protein [Paracraurococcus ruber]MBK1662064.1 hypothetical protein [Paracraurococcus ruber]TDG30150.1 hypothetical protein E2C05_15490 [Paracraurococcus ruber]
MAVLATGEQARSTRRPIVSNGVSAHLTTFIGSNRYLATGAPQRVPGPEEVYAMAFLVEQPAGSVVQAHFHEANQFQVVVAGGGRLGQHTLRPIAVHYSNAYSSYGPIEAGEEGLQYLTLRNGHDHGARYLPAAREELKGVRRRFREAVAELVPTGGPMPDAAMTEALLPEAADGLGAWRYRMPPGAALQGPDPATGDGQFWVVIGGSMQTPDSACLSALSCAFVGPEEESFAVTAREAGLEVVVVQFPRGRDHVPSAA